MEKNIVTMTEMFKGYFNYSDKEYKRIWKNSLIVVDTNILLNFYRYSDDTRKEFLGILNKLKDRLWIPYQVGKEFFNNKDDAMLKTYTEYGAIKENIQNNFIEAKKSINKIKDEQLKCKDKINSILEDSLNKIIDLLEKEKNENKPKFERNPIEKNIFELFDNNIGEQYEEEEYKQMRAEGLLRMEKQIPPGYKDKGKEENGDYYIFYSLIKKSKSDNKDIIFITDDAKEDWFNIVGGEKHGARYELLNEFYKETGNLLMLYTSAGFVKAYEKNIENTKIDDNIIDELIKVRNDEYIDKEKTMFNVYRNRTDIDILDYYRNDLISASKAIDKNDMLEHLFFIINNLHIPNNLSTVLRKELFRIKNNLYEESDRLIEKRILNLIDKIIYYNNEFGNNKEEVIDLHEIRYSYKKYLSDIKACRNELGKIKLYNRMEDTIQKHLKYLSPSEKIADYEMESVLKELLIIIKEDEKTGMFRREKIIQKLEYIVGYDREMLMG